MASKKEIEQALRSSVANGDMHRAAMLKDIYLSMPDDNSPSWANDKLAKSYDDSIGNFEFTELPKYKDMKSSEVIASPIKNQALKYATTTTFNIPGDAVKTAKNIGEGLVNAAVHPIDTIQGGLDLANSAVQKVLPQALVDYMHNEYPRTKENELLIDQAGKAFKERWIENPLKTIRDEPVGAALDLYGAKALLGPTVGKAVKKGSDITFGTISRLGTHTGTSLNEATRAGYKGGRTGKVFRENLRDQAPQQQALDMAQNALKGFKEDQLSKYKTTREAIRLESKPTINFKDVADDIKKEFTKGVNEKGYVTDSSAIGVKDAIQGEIDKFYETHGGMVTPTQLDDFKKGMYDAANAQVKSDTGRNILTAAYNKVKGRIIKEAPEFADMLKDYETMQLKLDEVKDTFKLAPGDRRIRNSAVRAFQDTLRNNANTNYGAKVKLLDEIQAMTDDPIKAALAGQSLNSLTSRGLGQLAQVLTTASALPANWPLAFPIAAVQSPRLMGEVAYKAGQLGRLTENAFKVPDTLLRENLGINPKFALAAAIANQNRDKEAK